eukprot:12358267-Heterocapsa_arctica.AAC.1
MFEIPRISINGRCPDLMPEIEAPLVPPPPVLDADQEEQVRVRRDLKAVALSREHLLTHKPAHPYCDACHRGKMRDAK